MNTKKYPFNIKKHAHDLEFQINRACNTMHDMLIGTIQFDEDEYDRLDKLKADLEDTISYFDEYPISYLPGKQYGIAKAAVNWAYEQRTATAIKKNFR